MRGAGLSKLIRMYLAAGLLWCVLFNLQAAVVGKPSAFFVAAASATFGGKLVTILRIVASQILLWPLDLYDKLGRPFFG